MQHRNSTPPASHYVQIGKHKMHYLDEGAGDIILFVHGIPEWSMLFADVVNRLSNQYRCIVPDHIGFGLSDKDEQADLTPKAHAERLLQFMQAVGITRPVHLVVHDYGGPIGMGALTVQPRLFRSLTIANTWLWRVEGPAAKGLRMMSGRMGKWLYLNYGFSVKFMAKNGFADAAKYEKYFPLFMQPHNTLTERYANYRLMMEMLASGQFFQDTNTRLHELRLPIQFIWGMKDKFFTVQEHLARWRQEFPGCKVHELPHSGHFPHLEQPDEFAKAVSSFVDELAN